jgi:hypothetical protein
VALNLDAFVPLPLDRLCLSIHSHGIANGQRSGIISSGPLLSRMPPSFPVRLPRTA